MAAIESATEARRKLAELLLKRRTRSALSDPVAAHSRPGLHPLHPAQERIWLLEQLASRAGQWNLSFARKLSGPFLPHALAQALSEIVRRHEPLRTRFRVEDGVPYQLIAPAWPVEIEVTDISVLPAAEREAVVRQQLSADRLQPFDLASGRLLRGRLWRLAPEQQVLLIVTHHIVCDGWSLGVLLRELLDLYGCCVQDRQPSLPPLEIGYIDFVHWFRDRLDSPALRAQADFWSERLTGIEPLSFARERLASAPASVVREFLELDSSLAGALDRTARSDGGTLFIVLAAALAALLYRYTGRTRSAIGTPVAGRIRPETEPLIGAFLNTVALTAEARIGLSLHDWIAAMRQAAFDAFANQELPFDRVLTAARIERDSRKNPLFQVSFAFQNTPLPGVSIAGVAIEPYPFDPAPPRLDLEIESWPNPQTGGITIMLARDPAVFSPAAGRALIAAYEKILHAIVATPRATVDSLRLLDSSVPTPSLRTSYELPVPALSLHEWVALTAARAPNRTAVTSAPGTLTYTELLARSGSIAALLLRRGIGAETIVGVCVDRHQLLPAALLGVLMAGGAYLPLDPSYPGERLRFMIEDAGVRHVLTETAFVSHWENRLPDVILLDETVSAQEPAIAAATAPTQLAYVIYTSGSTGRPKGVQVSHGAACQMLASMQRSPGMTPEDTLLAVTPISFDISVLELFLPLVSGGRLAIVSREVARDPFQLARAIRDNCATLVQATPSTWRMLVDAGWPARL